MNPEVFIHAIPEIVTQLVAFLTVFWILKKTVFGTVLKGIEDREKTITDAFDKIEAGKAEIARLEKEYRAKLHGIEQEARTKLQEAVQEGSRIAQEIKEKTRQDSLKVLERAKADIEHETEKARVIIRNQIVDLATKMAEKVVRKQISVRGDAAFNDDILKEVEDDILKGAGK